MTIRTSNKGPKLATPSGMESLEELAALLIRVHTYEMRGLAYRAAVITAAADFNANPASVLGRLREAAGRR